MKLWLDVCLGKNKQHLYPSTQSCEKLILQNKVMGWTSLNHPVIIIVIIRVWNIIKDSLCNKHVKRTWWISPFSLLQANISFKNHFWETIFAFSKLGYNLDVMWKNKMWMKKIFLGKIALHFSYDLQLYNCNH